MAVDSTQKTEQANSPQIKITGGSTVITRTYEQDWDYVEPSEINSFCELENYEHLILSDISINKVGGGSTARIVETYTKATSDGGSITRESYEQEFIMSDGAIEKSIEMHRKYLKNWNYDLIAKNGVTSSPMFWLTAKDGIMTDEESKSYKWIKTGNPIETGWYLLKSSEKPSVETYPVSTPIIQEKTYFRNKKTAFSYGGQINILKAPKETGTLASENKNWLIVSFSIQKEGNYWVVNRSYQFSEEWDTDIYTIG